MDTTLYKEYKRGYGNKIPLHIFLNYVKHKDMFSKLLKEYRQSKTEYSFLKWWYHESYSEYNNSSK